MPGPWSPSDVGAAGTRPGLYMNFIQVASAAVGVGDRGIVGIISEADWGPANEVVELDSYDAAVAVYTDQEDATSRLTNLVRLAFLGGAQTVKAVRVMKSTNAAKSADVLVDTTGAPVDVLDIEAKYFGTWGDNIEYDIMDDPIDATKTRIRVYADGLLVHSVTSTVNHGASGFIDNIVALFDALDSEWVAVTKIADGNNDLADVAAVTALTGGANGDAVTTTEFSTCLALFDANKIHILTSDTTNSGIRTVIKTWAVAKRAEGYLVMAVVGAATSESVNTIISNAQALNSHTMVYVGPGAIAPNIAGDLVTYNGATMAAMIAGLIAGVVPSKSITFSGLPTTTNVETSLSNTSIKSMLAAGVLVISSTPPGVNPAARVERGITTLYNPGEDDIVSYKSIRTVRTMDGIVEGLTEAANTLIIGQIPNDDNGKATVLGMFKDFLNLQVEARTIANTFTVRLDTTEDNTGPALFVLVALQPVDAIEFIFATISISV